MADFKKALAEILKYEGGYSNHPADRGGETNCGITKAVAESFGYTGSMVDIPVEIVEQIYKEGYWDRLNLDAMADDETAIKIFNIAVNCGVGIAGEILQRAYNLVCDGAMMLKVDRVVGTVTLSSVNSLSVNRLVALQKYINALHGYRYAEIIERDNTQKVFSLGWINRVRF